MWREDFRMWREDYPEENCVRIGKGSGSFGYTITATALSNNMKGSDENRWTSCKRISDDTALAKSLASLSSLAQFKQGV